MEKKVNIILSIILAIFIIGVYFVGYYRGINKGKAEAIPITAIPDTTYNKVVLDSIEYNIHIKDSTIVELKKKVKYEMEQAVNANDSDAVKQFYELAGAN